MIFVSSTVKKGLVERNQCKDDRRAVDVIITEKGLKLLEELDVKMEDWESQIQGINEDEARQLNQLLDKLRSK